MSDSEHPVNLKDYTRRCLLVLLAVACMTAMMIATNRLCARNARMRILPELTPGSPNFSVSAGC